MKPVRLIVVGLISLTGSVAITQTARAALPSCHLSTSRLHQGDSFVVTGNANFAGNTIHVFLDSNELSPGFSSGTPPTFSIPETMPLSASANATHEVTVIEGTSPAADCGPIFVDPAVVATATPAPTATPTPATTTPPIATFPVFIPITLSQQQQQQQQQQGGGGGGSPQQQQGHGGSVGGQQQQQQQQQQAPIIRDVASSILPRTGADAKRIGAWGAGLLAVGLLLVGWSRRRRRAAQSRALAELPPIDAVIVEPEGSWEPGMPHPSEFLSEADGVPPVYLPWPERRYLPAPEESSDDEDVLTPSF